MAVAPASSLASLFSVMLISPMEIVFGMPSTLRAANLKRFFSVYSLYSLSLTNSHSPLSALKPELRVSLAQADPALNINAMVVPLAS